MIAGTYSTETAITIAATAAFDLATINVKGRHMDAERGRDCPCQLIVPE